MGKTDADILKDMSIFEMDITEIWDRLLRTNKLIQRLFPKQSFLTALDDPHINE